MKSVPHKKVVESRPPKNRTLIADVSIRSEKNMGLPEKLTPRVPQGLNTA